MNEATQLAQANFKRWNDALQTGDAQVVAQLYTPDCTFLPTLSPELKLGLPGATAYFEHFLEKRPFGTITQEQVQTISDTAYLHVGMYDFALGPDDDRTTAHARFTYLWVKTPAGWQIAHHHSSLRPAG